MINNYFWLVLLPNFDCFFGFLSLFGFVVVIVMTFIYFLKKEESYSEEQKINLKKLGNTIIKLLVSSIIISFITCFIPTKKDILELKIISVVSQLKGYDQIPQKVVDRLNELLDGDKEKQ